MQHALQVQKITVHGFYISSATE